MASHRRRDLLEPGAPAPGFRLARLNGGDVSLAELTAAGPAALAFFKITCPVCQMTFPYLERIHAANGSVAIYGVSQNDARDTAEFVREFGITFPMLLDSEDEDFPASNAYGISSVPTLYLVEAGRISSVIEGWSRQDIAGLGERAGVNPIRPGDNVPLLKAG